LLFEEELELELDGGGGLLLLGGEELGGCGGCGVVGLLAGQPASRAALR